MSLYRKESLELLRQKIDLVEVLSSHVQFQRSGASFKACCPFHEEKTPSFIIQRGETHYHCYGCGAHGDAIAFLMGFCKMNFVEAIETLAERFQVPLEKDEDEEAVKGPNKNVLRKVLDQACKFYHFSLLSTAEGHAALEYLYQRGIDLDFIRQFRVGFAPRGHHVLHRVLKEEMALLEQVGLMSKGRDFFSDRITFPIQDAMGHVIGFSGRKFKEGTFGGKYINTPETPLFKKSHVLYGLSFCRQRIAKTRRAIIVEGQIDALRLIHAGFNFTVAGQGTAFGEGHVKELLNLGVNHVYLAMDGDKAGHEAAVKIGHLFQKKGVEVSIVPVPQGSDPDSLLKEYGPLEFTELLDKSSDYLTFLFKHMSKQLDLQSPSKKNELIQTISTQIREWEMPVMVHESLRKLAKIAQIPEVMIGVGDYQVPVTTPTYVTKRDKVLYSDIDPDRILETDLLRWMFFKADLFELIQMNLKTEDFRIGVCRRFFAYYAEHRPPDLLTVGIALDSNEDQTLLSEIMQKRINLQRAEEGLKETIQKILQREWMDAREKIKMKIQSGTCSEEEVLDLVKQFDEIKKNPPTVKWINT